MNDIVQLLAFHQKSIMPKIGANHVVLAIWNVFNYHLMVGRRKKQVARDAHHQRVRLDASQRLCHAASATPQVVRVVGLQQSVIGVGVEPTAQFFALVALI